VIQDVCVPESYPGANQRFSAPSPPDPPTIPVRNNHLLGCAGNQRQNLGVSVPAQTDFTPDAERDLINIFLHGIEHFGPVQAESYAKTLPTPRSGWRRITVSLSRAFAGTHAFFERHYDEIEELREEMEDQGRFIPLESET
jgi:hypothetical protein